MHIEVIGRPPLSPTHTLDHIQLNAIQNLSREDNLVFKAIQRFSIETGLNLPAMKIHIDKAIPMGAGLGGGSSNAASALILVNSLMGTPLSVAALAKIGVSLGADVPIFIHQKHAWAEGIGDIISPIEIEPIHCLLAFPDAHINTAQAFQSSELERTHTPLKRKNTIFSLNDHSHNHFESLIRQQNRAIDSCFQQLSRFGIPRLSGTGACVFLPFQDLSSALQALKQLQSKSCSFHMQIASSIR